MAEKKFGYPPLFNSNRVCFERSSRAISSFLMTFDLFWPVTLNDHQCQSLNLWNGVAAAAQKNLNENFLLTGSFIFLVTVLSFGHSMDEEMMQKPECQMWAKLENKTLPLQDQGHANCTTNSDCTGFSCKGIYQVRKSLICISAYFGDYQTRKRTLQLMICFFNPENFKIQCTIKRMPCHTSQHGLLLHGNGWIL